MEFLGISLAVSYAILAASAAPHGFYPISTDGVENVPARANR